MDLAGHLGGAVGVGGPDRAGQPELAVIGQRDRVLIAVVGDHRQHRAEDLLLGDAVGVVDVGEDRRRDEPTPRLILRNTAADNEFRAAALTGLDVVEHPVALPRADHRADIGRPVQWVAHGEAVDEISEGVDDFGVPGSRRQDPRAQVTGLAVVDERHRPQAAHGGVEVGVIEDDRRRLATEFECDRPQQSPTHLADDASSRGGPGEADLVHTGMGYQVFACLDPAGYDIEHTGRHPALLGRFRENQGIQSGFGCRLEHHGATGRERGCEFKRGEGLRIVPRNDRGDHPDGLATDDRMADRTRPDLLDRSLGDELGVIAQQRRREQSVGSPRQRHRHAVLPGHQFVGGLGTCVQCGGECQQYSSAVVR